jgi:hypothetical protein
VESADTRAAVVIPIGILVVLYALALTGFSIGGTGDTPCGALLDPSFYPAFDTEQVCGMMHLGTLVLVVGLVVGGCGLLVLAALALRGRVDAIVTAWVAAGMAVLAVLAWALLAWRVSTWDAFHPRGWTPVRNVVGFTSIGLVVAAALIGVIVGPGGHRSSSSR